jgi:hypothetical protein
VPAVSSNGIRGALRPELSLLAFCTFPAADRSFRRAKLKFGCAKLCPIVGALGVEGRSPNHLLRSWLRASTRVNQIRITKSGKPLTPLLSGSCRGVAAAWSREPRAGQRTGGFG